MGLASKLKEQSAAGNAPLPVEEVARSPPPSSSSSSNPAPVHASEVDKLIRECVKRNKLSHFYPEDRLRTVISRREKLLIERLYQASALNWDGLASNWRIKIDKVLALCQLALYDVIFFIDDSGSMQFQEEGTRISDMHALLDKIVQIVSLFDDDGVNREGNGVKNQGDITNLLAGLEYKYAIRVLNKFAYIPTVNKPLLIIVITDGEPSGEDKGKLASVIEHCVERMSKTKYGPKAVSFEFCQVGRDKGAMEFLDDLDNLKSKKGGIRTGEVIDTISYYEMEEDQMKKKHIDLTPELYVLKLALGSIDDSFDNLD